MTFEVSQDTRGRFAEAIARDNSGEIIGTDGDRRGTFMFNRHEPGWLVMVEPVGSRDRFWLADPPLGEEPVQVTCCVKTFYYPRMFLVGAELVQRAADYFFTTGRCSPDQVFLEV
jgi:hypothetical protein